ncbi:hypothetical protein V1511DRAFT_487496 [Dipodascopsis uninucleata]
MSRLPEIPRSLGDPFSSDLHRSFTTAHRLPQQTYSKRRTRVRDDSISFAYKPVDGVNEYNKEILVSPDWLKDMKEPNKRGAKRKRQDTQDNIEQLTIKVEEDIPVSAASPILSSNLSSSPPPSKRLTPTPVNRIRANTTVLPEDLTPTFQARKFLKLESEMPQNQRREPLSEHVNESSIVDTGDERQLGPSKICILNRSEPMDAKNPITQYEKSSESDWNLTNNKLNGSPVTQKSRRVKSLRSSIPKSSIPVYRDPPEPKKTTKNTATLEVARRMTNKFSCKVDIPHIQNTSSDSDDLLAIPIQKIHNTQKADMQVPEVESIGDLQTKNDGCIITAPRATSTPLRSRISNDLFTKPNNGNEMISPIEIDRNANDRRLSNKLYITLPDLAPARTTEPTGISDLTSLRQALPIKRALSPDIIPVYGEHFPAESAVPLIASNDAEPAVLSPIKRRTRRAPPVRTNGKRAPSVVRRVMTRSASLAASASRTSTNSSASTIHEQKIRSRSQQQRSAKATNLKAVNEYQDEEDELCGSSNQIPPILCELRSLYGDDVSGPY